MQIASGNLSDDDNNIDDSKQVMACPTVVFPTRKIAWGSVTPMYGNTTLEEEAQEYIVDVENYWSEEEKEQYGYTSDKDNACDEMVIIPAVNGRLLRFDGAAFHAVPRPASRFLMDEQELAIFLEREKEEEDDDDDYWDDDNDGYDDMEEENISKRSVILFNTWPEGSTPHRQGLHRYLKKSQSASNTHNCNGPIMAKFVELNI